LIYPYACPNCDRRFDVVKHHSFHKEAEQCPNCETIADRVYGGHAIKTMFRSEYNPGLGCVVKNDKHKRDLCKEKGLVEVGNESKDSMHKYAEKTLKNNLSWDNVKI